MHTTVLAKIQLKNQFLIKELRSVVRDASIITLIKTVLKLE